MIRKIEIEGFNCACVSYDAGSRVVYMIYPQVEEFSDEWLERESEKNRCSIIVIYIPLNKWNDWLTPWPEPGETPKAQPFAGDAPQFMKTLQQQIIPKAENALDIKDISERDLIGVSLAGLFTLWQWMRCDTFTSIACLSGSFWYEGFIEWFERQAIPQKTGKAYFLLGAEEPKSHIKAYRSVGVNTEAIVTRLKAAGIDTTFDRVPGNHFADPLQRAEKAIENIRRRSPP